MAFLDVIFRKKGFRKFQDSYALNRPSLWTGLRAAVQRRLLTGQVVLLVAHFPDTFTQLQDELEAWQVEYDVETEPLNDDSIHRRCSQSNCRVHLALAETVQPAESYGAATERKPEITMMVCERHPLPDRDRVLEQFGRNSPFPVELGYFLSLDDDVVRYVVNDTTIQILQQLGLDDHELITSHMVTKRMNTVLDRLASKVDSEMPADSAREWFELNDPQRA